jgi:hypothetical protein
VGPTPAKQHFEIIFVWQAYTAMPRLQGPGIYKYTFDGQGSVRQLSNIPFLTNAKGQVKDFLGDLSEKDILTFQWNTSLEKCNAGCAMGVSV